MVNLLLLIQYIIKELQDPIRVNDFQKNYWLMTYIYCPYIMNN